MYRIFSSIIFSDTLIISNNKETMMLVLCQHPARGQLPEVSIVIIPIFTVEERAVQIFRMKMYNTRLSLLIQIILIKMSGRRLFYRKCLT